MTMLKKACLGFMLALGMASTAFSAIITADIELDFFDSGEGPIAGPYGGDFLGSGFPIPLTDTLNARDGNLGTFVSLPTGSFLTVGFSSGFIFDGLGDDIFVSEAGSANELADVFVSSDGISFTFLGVAGANGTTNFDLADIGYVGNVTAIKVVGLDSLGGSPGYDLAVVQGLEGSVVFTSAPATLGLILLSAFFLRRKLTK